VECITESNIPYLFKRYSLFLLLLSLLDLKICEHALSPLIFCTKFLYFFGCPSSSFRLGIGFSSSLYNLSIFPGFFPRFLGQRQQVSAGSSYNLDKADKTSHDQAKPVTPIQTDLWGGILFRIQFRYAPVGCGGAHFVHCGNCVLSMILCMSELAVNALSDVNTI
jgi:hypothetical protein